MAVFVGVFNLIDYQKQITYKNQILLSLDSIKLYRHETTTSTISFDAFFLWGIFAGFFRS
jgi:hypothetical protein